MTKKDIEKALKYLSDKGYGRGSNYTTNTVASLMVEYAAEQVKLFAIPDVRLSLFNFIDSQEPEDIVRILKEIDDFDINRCSWCKVCGKLMPEECNGWHGNNEA